MNDVGFYETDSIENENSIHRLMYAFVSKGKTDINKLIVYSKIRHQIKVPSVGFMTVYNLGFGDQKENSFEIDHFARSNNGNMIQVYNTVINTVPLFFELHPNTCLFVTGSDQKRKNIYSGYVSRHFATFSTEYTFFGQEQGAKFVPFECRKPYEGLLFYPNRPIMIL